MRFLIFIILSAILIGCENDFSTILMPVPNESSIPKGSLSIPQAAKDKIEGVYKVIAGNNNFGNDVVLKWNGESLSVFSGKQAAYFILQSGYQDSTMYFDGYWRAATGSATGLARFKIKKRNGARQLLNNIQPDSIIFTGFFGDGNDIPTRELIFKYDYPLKEDGSSFYIIGHRGGGRNIDRLPHSENSLGMIEFAGHLGANAVELDVRRTKDGVPVLFHDEYLNKRLINEDYFIGKVSDYTFAQLRSFCTLINGEQIPTLEEALKTIVEKTHLKLVWLDMKAPESMSDVISLQQKYLDLAVNLNRDLEMIIGIPDDGILKTFTNVENFENIPSLCELNTEKVIEANSLIWAPRWSLGLLNDQVTDMHAMGKRVFIWTLDDQILIRKFLNEGNFDGFVTNYPTLTAYEYFRQK